jgi:hypothetical protein
MSDPRRGPQPLGERQYLESFLCRHLPRLDQRKALLRALLGAAAAGEGAGSVLLLAGTMTIPGGGQRSQGGPLPFVMIVERPWRRLGPQPARAVEVVELGDVQFLRPTLAITMVSR